MATQQHNLGVPGLCRLPHTSMGRPTSWGSDTTTLGGENKKSIKKALTHTKQNIILLGTICTDPWTSNCMKFQAFSTSKIWGAQNHI